MRRAATVVGMSWIEAVFISTKVTMLSVAVSERLRRFISRMAAIPSGVAALPSPKRFALRFSEIRLNACESGGISGYSRLRNGAKSRESFSISPLSFAIRMKPDHITIMPLMEIKSCTASPAESSRPSLIWGSAPLTAEYKNAAAIIAPNTYAILSRLSCISQKWLTFSVHVSQNLIMLVDILTYFPAFGRILS